MVRTGAGVPLTLLAAVAISTKLRHARWCRSDMRAWLPVAMFLVGCGNDAVRVARRPEPNPASAISSIPAPAAPSPVPAAEPMPPIGALASTQTFHIVEVIGATARCQPWTLDSEAAVLRTTRQLGTGTVTDELELAIVGAQISFTSITRTHADERTSSTTCDTVVQASPAASGVVVDGARWFSVAADCEAAVREQRRVAMRFGCELPVETAAKRAKATRTKFDQMLARGGTLYSIVEAPRGDRCKRVRVVPHGKDRRVFEGSFTWAIVENGVKGTMSLGYTLGRGETNMSLTGPGVELEDGSGWGMGCLGFAEVDARDGYVQLADAMYFTEQACRAAIKQRDARAAWFPRHDDVTVADAVTTESHPSIGGC